MSNFKDDEPRVVMVIGGSFCTRFSPSVEALSLLGKLNDVAVVCFDNCDDARFDSGFRPGVDFQLKRVVRVPELPKSLFIKADNIARNKSWKRQQQEASRNAGLKFKAKK